MKKISEEDFTDRMQALQRAERIFIDAGLTDNITTAFRAYQSIFAERERDIFLSTQIFGNRPRAALDRYERPQCPTCTADMMIRPVPENTENIKTQLVCTNIKCDTVLNSEHDLDWWVTNLETKI
jgi:hypothetical protein